MEDPKWMVLKSVSLIPAKPGGLIDKYIYRADTVRLAGDEIISKGLTKEEAVALVKVMQ